MSFPETPLHSQLSAPTPPPAPNVPEVASAEDDFPFDHPVKEARFQAAWKILKTTPDPRAKPNWWFFLIIVGLTALAFFQGGNFDPWFLVMTVGVLALHDLGHVLGMKFFGYTDTNLFIIPFFAALVTGKRHAAPAWQQSLTILLGPLPGLLLGLAWYLRVRDEVTHWELHLIAVLIGLNLLHLLPFGMFDGGRMLRLVLFSRNAWIESFIQLATALAFAALAYFLGSHFLWAFAAVTALGVPFRFRKGQMIARLRRDGLEMPDTISELTTLQGRMLFAAAYDVLKNRVVPDPIMAATMRELHDRVLVPPPGLLGTVAILLLFFATFCLGVVTPALIGYDIDNLCRELDNFGANHLRQAWEAARQRRLANQLQGQAKDEALHRVAQMEQAIRDKHVTLRRKLDTFHSLFPIGNAPNDPFGQPDNDNPPQEIGKNPPGWRVR